MGVEYSGLFAAVRRLDKPAPTGSASSTHFAVSPDHCGSGLASGGGLMLIAKGSDFLALKMREIAVNDNVLLLESPALARFWKLTGTWVANIFCTYEWVGGRGYLNVQGGGFH